MRGVGRALLMMLLLSAIAMSVAACGDDPVSASSVDQALRLMTGDDQPACVKKMDFGDGSAEFRCGHYFCWTTAHASYTGVGHVVDGADYYDCDKRFAPWTRTGNGTYELWEKCVVDTHPRMSVLSSKECNMRAWMKGSEIGGF